MAGQYDRIILANVVNEFPAEYVEDLRAREAYMTAMQEERNEAQHFIDVVMNSEIPHLFDNKHDHLRIFQPSYICLLL